MKRISIMSGLTSNKHKPFITSIVVSGTIQILILDQFLKQVVGFFT